MPPAATADRRWRPSPARILELRIPIGAPPARRQVEDVPQRRRVGCAARILAGIARAAELRTPEVAHHAVALDPDVERRPFVAVGRQAAVVTREVVVDRGVELQVAPAALACKGQLPLDRRAAD